MKSPLKIVDEIEKALRSIYNRPCGPIPLHAPCFRGNEWDYVKSCIDTGWVSTVGAYVERFERMVCEFTGASHAVATVNGTAGLHIALLLSGVEPGDEVLCPAFTFVATVSAVMYCRARPVFMDSDVKSLGIDAAKVRRFLSEKTRRGKDGFTYNVGSGARVKACVPMHAYGFPVDMEPLLSVCAEYNICVVEDAAEALGSEYQGKHCGTIGRMGVLSFNGNKIITTGGGGMILTDDPDTAMHAKHLTTTAKVGRPWEYLHDEIGYNYRMPNLNAALGCAQIENLAGFLERKRTQTEMLKEALDDSQSVRLVLPIVGKGNHWFNLCAIDPSSRDEVVTRLNERGIGARASWAPISDMKPYSEYETAGVEVSRALALSIICLPNGLAVDDPSR